VHLFKFANASSYNFPAKIRPLEPGRTRITVRNTGTTDFTVGYSSSSVTNSDSNGAASYPNTVSPGQEFVDSGTVAAMYIRPAVSGNGVNAVVISEIGAF
jgi:hypothetical protein